MKTKKLITKIISALLIMVLVATCAPVTGFAASDDVSKIDYIANTTVGVKIRFTAVDGASSYKIFRQAEDEAFEEIASATSTTFIDKDVVNGVMYTYYAEAELNAKGFKASNSVDEDITKSILYVEAPLFTVENSDIGPVIKIEPVEGAIYYNIKRCDEGSSVYNKIGTVENNSDLCFTDVDVENGKSYQYIVTAVMYEGSSYYNSASVVAEIAEVMTEENATDITYIANKKEGIKLNFKKVEDAESYTLYRKTGDGTFKAIAVTEDTTYVDTAVESGVLYTYKVAVTGYYFSENERSMMFLDVPAFTLANAGTGVIVNFEAVDGAQGYTIKRHDETTSVFTKIGSVAADEPLCFFDDTAENGKTYTYCVTAYNDKYFSYYDAVDFEAFLTSPVVLTNVQTGVKVAYTKMNDATQYTIYRRTDDTDWVAVSSFKPLTYFYDVDKTAVSGVEYYYAVQVNAGEKCTGIDPVGVKIMYLECPSITLSNDDSSVTIDFTATPGAVSYNILKKLPNSSSYKTIGTVSASDALTFVDTDVVEGETYEYGIRAKNGKYNSYFNTEKIEVAVISMDSFITDVIATVVPATDDSTKTTDTPAADKAATTDVVNTITDAANRVTGILKILQKIINILLFIPNTISAFNTVANIFKLFV